MFSFGNAMEPPRYPLVGPGHPRHLKKKKKKLKALPIRVTTCRQEIWTVKSEEEQRKKVISFSLVLKVSKLRNRRPCGLQVQAKIDVAKVPDPLFLGRTRNC